MQSQPYRLLDESEYLTLEDVLEAIVGDIRDESDLDDDVDGRARGRAGVDDRTAERGHRSRDERDDRSDHG